MEEDNGKGLKKVDSLVVKEPVQIQSEIDPSEKPVSGGAAETSGEWIQVDRSRRPKGAKSKAKSHIKSYSELDFDSLEAEVESLYYA